MSQTSLHSYLLTRLYWTKDLWTCLQFLLGTIILLMFLVNCRPISLLHIICTTSKSTYMKEYLLWRDKSISSLRQNSMPFMNSLIRIWRQDLSVLFVQKKDSSLQLCVNSRSLNKISTKNKYSLSLFTDLLDVSQKV